MNKLIVISPAHSANGRCLSGEGLFQAESLASKINALADGKKIIVFHSVTVAVSATASCLVDTVSAEVYTHEFVQLSGYSYKSGREAARGFYHFYSDDPLFYEDTVIIMIAHSAAVSGIVDYFLKVNDKHFACLEVGDASGFCFDSESRDVTDFSWAD